MSDGISADRAILGAVRGAQAGNDDAERIAAELAAIGSAPPVAITAGERWEHFLNRCKINNIEVHGATSRSDAVKRIARFIYTEHNSYRAVAGNDRRLAAMPWRDGGVLVRFGAAAPADPVAISYAQCGVAETGSVLLFSNRDNPASNNWLCRHHIVLMDEAMLVGNLEEAWAVVRHQTAGRLPYRGTHLISGPSSTGDIVGHIVTGAHGPQRLLLIVLGRVDTALLEACGHPQMPVPD